jgi:hypothetical protein
MNPIGFEDFENALERRKADLGFTGAGYVLPNSGETRTLEKRELLRLIEAAADARGVEPIFKANI